MTVEIIISLKKSGGLDSEIVFLASWINMRIWKTESAFSVTHRVSASKLDSNAAH